MVRLCGSMCDHASDFLRFSYSAAAPGSTCDKNNVMLVKFQDLRSIHKPFINTTPSLALVFRGSAHARARTQCIALYPSVCRLAPSFRAWGPSGDARGNNCRSSSPFGALPFKIGYTLQWWLSQVVRVSSEFWRKVLWSSLAVQYQVCMHVCIVTQLVDLNTRWNTGY